MLLQPSFYWASYCSNWKHHNVKSKMTLVKENLALSSWETIVKQKRMIQADALAPYLEQEIPATDAITDIDDVEELAQLLSKGDLRAEDVILAYIRR